MNVSFEYAITSLLIIFIFVYIAFESWEKQKERDLTLERIAKATEDLAEAKAK